MGDVRLGVLLQAPILCGCFLVWAFTESGARRSELPSRRTGIDSAAFDLVVPGLDVLLFIVFGIFGILGKLVALTLQFLDGLLESGESRR